MKKILGTIIIGVLLAFVIALIVTIWQTSDDMGRLIFCLILSPFGFGTFGITLSRLFYQ